MKRQLGLIGKKLSHSFSKRYFEEKFKKESIVGYCYELYELTEISEVKRIFKINNILGFNVTIPYKHEVMEYMDDFDHSANKVGAVNVVKIAADGKRIGYNSDYYGFRNSLVNWIPDTHLAKALVLGVGGAAKAVYAVLDDLAVTYLRISRDSSKGDLTYEELKNELKILSDYPLIINTTPLGMSPKIDAKPDLVYSSLNKDNYLYDLIYNPAETKFLSEGRIRGAQTKNGLEMLELQAEKSWEIWNK